MTQIGYLEILFNDVGIIDRTQRNAFCSTRVNREIKFLDDLNTRERSMLIDELKALKQARGGYTKVEEE